MAPRKASASATLGSEPGVTGTSIAAQFDTRANSLNFVRLVLASLVIWTHAEVITQGVNRGGIFDPLVGQAPVDGFFALSGFLIARSWLRRPLIRDFLRARVARIFPGFWACLAITSLFFVPLSSALHSESPFSSLGGTSWLRYILANSSLVVVQHSISGTPNGVPLPEDWNGSLWTLKWEFACYLAVLLIGALGLLASRWVNLGALATCWAISIAAVAYDLPRFVGDVGRFGLMYEVGIILYLFRERIRVSISGAILAMTVVVVSAEWLPDYRLLAAGALGYVLLCFGLLVRHPRLRLPNDISYGMYIYGFPIEQLMAHTGLVRLDPFLFFLLATAITIGPASASWFLVERPAQRFIRSVGSTQRRDRHAPSPVNSTGK